MGIPVEESTSNGHQQMDNHPDLSIAVRTLTAGGFLLEGAERNPGYTILYMSRVDEFGATHHYCFALADGHLGKTQIAAARIAAEHHRAQLILITRSSSFLFLTFYPSEW